MHDPRRDDFEGTVEIDVELDEATDRTAARRISGFWAESTSGSR